jgi:hypothetical protein
MSKRIDHGLEKAPKKRARPPVTHRLVHPEQTAAERARVPQNQLAPSMDADTPEGTPKKARRRKVKK